MKIFNTKDLKRTKDNKKQSKKVGLLIRCGTQPLMVIINGGLRTVLDLTTKLTIFKHKFLINGM
jgi:hypothetical protein